jgi:hypothetical protein
MVSFFQNKTGYRIDSNLFCAALEKVVREQRVLYGKHMDITSYDGKRETHNPAGGTSKKKNNYVINKLFCSEQRFENQVT